MILDPADQKHCPRCDQWFPRVVFGGYAHCPTCRVPSCRHEGETCAAPCVDKCNDQEAPGRGVAYIMEAHPEGISPCKHFHDFPPCPGTEMGLSCDPPCSHYEPKDT